ncbi:MAG: phospholipase A [Campylobacteraceae bacterium]|jgi:phospholipase A1|nr:phospholipase A [Campylobacteraceae bacterium]
MKMLFMIIAFASVLYSALLDNTSQNISTKQTELETFLAGKETTAGYNATLERNKYVSYLNEYEDNETKSTVFQLLSSSYGILPYKTNILAPITYDFAKHDDNRRETETFFQLSFRKDLLQNFLGFNEIFTISYTQRSWWQTMKHSTPFRETNYLPEAFLYLPFWNDSSSFKGYKFAFLHESNGQNDPFSRSWNRLYAEGFFHLKGLFINPRVWYRIEEGKNDDNPDILDYMGYGDLTLIYPYKEQLFKLLIRNNFDFSDNRGAVQFEWTFSLKNTFAYLYYFDGYGESLIDYNQKSRRIGLGFAISR